MYGFDGGVYNAKKYIEMYSVGKDPLRNIMQVLSDVEKVLGLILEVKETAIKE